MAIIGFTAIMRDVEERNSSKISFQRSILGYFNDLSYSSVNIGNTQLEVWGRTNLQSCLHWTLDGNLLVLIGSPIGLVNWPEVEHQLNGVSQPTDFEPPWDGRVILLKINADGKHWALWNDWVGSITVFHAGLPNGWIMSTLEQVVVSAASLTTNDFFMPGLVSLLIHGHYLGDWTLFKSMKVVPPDSMCEWDLKGYKCHHLSSVSPSPDRWESGWDELVDEMYVLSYKAVVDALENESRWILPLSGGLDSRLIAAVGANEGIDLYTYTYGPARTRDTIHARQVAKALNLPWKRIDLGKNYLSQHTALWAELFGSSMHFHGMYQMPFLDSLQSEPTGSIAVGFLGESLAGGHLRPLIAIHSNQKHYQLLPDGWVFWLVNEIGNLLKVSVTDTLEQIHEEILRQINSVSGAWFQRLMFLDFWNRQRLFISFQSNLCAYWRGVATPFLNRDYARFCLSLPRLALDHRRLQADMYRRYYGKLAVIPGTYASEPFILTGSYLAKRRIANRLPKFLHHNMLQEFSPAPVRMDQECVQVHGWSSLWPIEKATTSLEAWVDIDCVTDAYNNAINGNSLKPLRKLQAIQALAYRLLNQQERDV